MQFLIEPYFEIKEFTNFIEVHCTTLDFDEET